MAGSISTLGIGSGLELQSILDQLKSADSIPIKQKQAKQLLYKDRISEFDVLQSKLLSTKSDALNLSLQSTYLGSASSVSDSSIFTSSSVDGAALGSYHVKVNNLAKKSAWKADTGLSSGTDYVNSTGSDLSFSYEVDGKSTTLNVPTGTTLTAFASMINDDADNPGVKASVVQDGTGSSAYKLLIQADSTGETGRISMTGQLSSYNISETTGSGGASLNSELEIDGVTYQRSSNSISDIVSGATLNLQSVGEATLTIETDKTAIKDKIKSFVTNLTDVISEIDTNDDYNKETKVGGSFYNISSLHLFKSQLVNDVINPINIDGSSITSAVDLGIEYTRDGKITLDEDTLSKAIDNNFDDVKKFLLGDSDNNITGWADTVNTRLRSATSSVDGLVKTEKDASQTIYDKLSAQIINDQARLDKRYEIMSKQFLQLDKYMSSMNNMSTYLSQQITSMNAASSSNS